MRLTDGDTLRFEKGSTTVDINPVRHGSWVPNEKFGEYQERYTYICSECGEEAPNDGYDCGANFCPRCGAKMTNLYAINRKIRRGERMMELKPCPFCGKEPVMQTDRRWPDGIDDGIAAFEIICANPDCVIYRADNRYFTTREEAIEAWNSRVTD